MRSSPFPVAVRLRLPPLPPSFRGAILRTPGETAPWCGASGPFWHPPLAVLSPRDTEDVATAVGWAAREGIPLIPRGGGTAMPGGNVGSGVILDLCRLDGIASPEAAAPMDAPASVVAHGPSVTLRAGAGAVAADLRDRAREAAMELPALPSSARWCTLGGILACNAAGARSFRHGAARSWVREVEWVRSDGRVERLTRGRPPAPEWGTLARELRQTLPDPLPWPRVRKNSSGYALDAFLPHGEPVALAVGSEGTLGVLTEAVLELTPPPQARGVALVGVPDLPFLVEAATAVAGIAAVEACEYFGRRLVELGGLGDEARLTGLSLAHGLLLLEVAGDPGEVEDALAALSRISRGAGMVTARDPEGMETLWEFRHAASPTIARELAHGRRSTQFIEDSVVPVPALGAYIEGLDRILARHRTDAVLFGHAGDGNLHVNPLVELGHPRWRATVREILEETVALVASLGGTLAGEHGDGRLRTPYLERIFQPEVVRGFARVKESLDPAGILNPGVKVPLPGTDPLAGLGDAPGFALGSQGPEGRR